MEFDGESYERKDELKRLFKRLGEVINDSLSHSREVQDILSEIRVFGLGVDLSMVIGLGLYSRSDGGQDIIFDPDELPEEKIRFELTSGDAKFLEHHKLKLSLDKDMADGAETDSP